MTFVQIEKRNGMINLDGYSRNKTLKGALKDLAREVAKIDEGEGKCISDYINETAEMVAAGMPNEANCYYIEAQEVPCASRYKFLNGDEDDYSEENVEMEYAEGHWYLYIRFCAPEQESEEQEAEQTASAPVATTSTKKQNEVRYIVTSVVSIPVYKLGSKNEAYKQATKPGWGTVEWYSAEDGYKNPVNRDRSDKTQEMYCDEDCYADIYTKSGRYFGIGPYETINTKEMPKQPEVAAIIHGDSCGFDFWAEDCSLIHIFVTYDENGLIDNYRIEYGPDATAYDEETELTFEDLFVQPEGDWQETYRAEIPGTMEYYNKREAAALAQESGETWMDDEQREQFRRVCYQISRIKSAWDFFVTMQSLEYDFDKKIINAARKFKNCLNYAQYEQPREVARREELLEDYEKYEFVMPDTTETESTDAGAMQMASATRTSKAAPVAADIALTEEEVKFFNDTVARIKYSVNVNVPIEIMNHEQLDRKHREALGICWAEDDGTGKPVPFRITIDEYFVHECYVAIERPYMKLEPHTLEQVIAHEIAHLHVWRHGKKHTELTRHICRLIEKGEPHGLENSGPAPAAQEEKDPNRVIFSDFPVDAPRIGEYNRDILNREATNMTTTLKKVEKFWVLIIDREDGTRNDYRFTTKREAQAWLKAVGISA